MRWLLSGFLSFVACVQLARSATPEQTEFFEKSVRPVLVEQCQKCHGPEKQKAELRLDSREALLKGSDAGPVVVLGKPEESSLIKSIRHEGDSKMPEKADKLSDEQIAALSEWVKMGLPWPANDTAKLSLQQQAAKTHWSFQPVLKIDPPVPGAAAKLAIQNPIDAFIAEKLAAAGLESAPPASRRALIRRASYDLIGLPPTFAEIASFESDTAPGAFERVVDRLLSSPHYGERWGRYWLDVARYADTKGYVFQEERKYPFAYVYRDWVVRALNDDMPYDQFLVRQIAADHLNEGPESLAALGFLTLGRRFINNIHDIIDDRIDVISRGTMALTTTCARCHDHKFDPISQKDYYALYGIFASSREPELQELPVLASATPHPEYVKARAAREAAISEYRAKRGLEISYVHLQLQGSPAFFPEPVIQALFESRFFTRKARDELRDMRNKMAQVENGPNAPPRPPALFDKPRPVTPRVFVRGNASRPGEEVPRRFISVLAGGNPQPFQKGSGRLELARAIASKDNPLTARVIVNRVWALHFGAGLVRTPGDFGVKGEPPTHPELLDWLATWFVENGWSLKKLHRLVMASSAYQQSSDATRDAQLKDPENRLVSRMNRRRLDFEAFRDSLLAASGQLDGTIGGRSVDITSPGAKRRSIYAFIDRQNLPGMFRTFDFASPDTTSVQRHLTTVPQQALFMMNHGFVLEQARALVDRPEFAKDAVGEAHIQQLYERIFSRRAEPNEVQAGLDFVAAQKSEPSIDEVGPVWQYGFGGYDETARTVSFTALPHFTKYAWQGSAKLPDPKLGWVMLNATGGHAGGDGRHAAIRRWTAPAAGTVSISGFVERPSKAGDGILARVVSRTKGELLKIAVEPGGKVEAKVDPVNVERGETIDFLVECRGNENSDSFNWSPLIRADGREWNAQPEFAGPPPPKPKPLSPWEKYAQVLLATNEFAFVD